MQQPKRFQAPTLTEAYAKVRAELGGDAVILSTRRALAPGLHGRPGREFVEVVALLPEADPAMHDIGLDLEQDLAAHDLVRGVAEASAAGIDLVAGMELAPPFENERAGTARPEDLGFGVPGSRHPAGDEPSPTAAPPPSGEASFADRALGGVLSRQLAEVRALLDGLVADRVADRVESGPESLRQVHDLLARQGLSPALLSPLLAQVSDALVRGDDVQSALRTVERKLATRFPTVPRVDFARRPAAIFLVGPAGAGKTTLAVRLALEIERAHALRVAIAGTDVHRAGAPQQLAAYGGATGIDTRLCYAPDELRDL
ncbi:MAG: hypothetical protein WD734_03395, partial [Dehalococcoidia bacterium]